MKPSLGKATVKVVSIRNHRSRGNPTEKAGRNAPMPPGFRQGYSSDPYTSSLPTMVASTVMSRIAFLSTARGLSPKHDHVGQLCRFEAALARFLTGLIAAHEVTLRSASMTEMVYSSPRTCPLLVRRLTADHTESRGSMGVTNVSLWLLNRMPRFRALRSG